MVPPFHRNDAMDSAIAARNRIESGGVAVDIFRRIPWRHAMAYASRTPRG
jgi:hypothetical protein